MTASTPGNSRPSTWLEIIAADPGHSHRYRERFRDLAARGQDIDGEARLIDAMVDRGAHVLDAGCGAGRLGGFLSAAGHSVVGVDIDPVLIEAAGSDYPGPTWLVGDLAELDLRGEGIDAAFDMIVSAGNVVTFLDPDDRRTVLARFTEHLAPDGRVVVGFGAGRGYPFDDFLADAAAGGLVSELLLSAWDVRPFTPESDFLVAVLRHSPR
ncbi:class I SAM-dependent methyltransferase [Gordonia sp. LSe1-13]|uniref:Class I SAM-dependent methyltransferase n=1 Tax=Gordonia sesuvii TaxID=3116777 RepID=A0ABU7ML60_9ACTN|nr:class I SAM-dependent methyltransferase [Gordonia sp. LSe1-13]